MSRLQRLWDSSVGKKAVMGVTGLIWRAYVIGHMVGNLQIFQGTERINAYGRSFTGRHELLWVVRVVLVLAVVLHVVAACAAHDARSGRPPGRATPGASPRPRRLPRGRCGGAACSCSSSSWFTSSTSPRAPFARRIFAEGDVYGNVALGIPDSVGIRVLHRIDGGPRHAPVSRSVEPFRSLGAAQPSPQPLRRRLALLMRRRGGRWICRRADRGPGRLRWRRAMTVVLDSKVPAGPIEQKWDTHRFEMKLVNPANKRKYTVIVVGQRPRRRLGRRDAGRARLQREVLLLPGLARGARTASPRRAASTPPRTTGTTATASTASSTTRSRAATSARARPTSTAWPR